MLIKTKQEAMAYKQEKNPLRRDGASIDPITASIGLKLLAKKALGKVAAKVAPKVIGKVAPKLLPKVTSAIAKATPKAMPKSAKLIKTTSSMPKLQPLGQTGGKVGKLENIVSKGKNVAGKVNTKVDDLATKASDFSKEIGLDRSPEEIKDMAKEKLLNASQQITDRIGRAEPAPMNKTKEEKEFDISKSSYSNPATINMGPSKSLKNISTTQDVGKKSLQQFGAEMKFNALAQHGTSQEKDISEGFALPAGEVKSLDKSNLGKNFLNNFDAYANVGGVVFNVGDVARLGYAGVKKFIENKPKREKRRGERDIKKQTKKQPPVSIISKREDINNKTGSILS